MTGVDVEHTKARLSEIRKQMDLVRSFGIGIGPSTPWELITIAVGLVAAVERVQALHTPWTNPIGELWCLECTRPHPCPTAEALETP